MKTIEERANKFAIEYVERDSTTISNLLNMVAKECYIAGATEQRQIDINNACEWWINYLAYPTDSNEDRARVKEMVDEFRKAMEK